MPTERKARILAVDDDPAVCYMLERVLTREGYAVVGMADAAGGPPATATALDGFDLVIANSHMPHLTGDQMAAVLRGRFPGLPILHLNDLSWLVGARPAHEVPSLPGPFRLDALLAAVRQLLG
jgi:DNA-binding response OmpR family regulator